jgi:hypothetical protein
MAKVNRQTQLILTDNQGVHWSDIPEGVTVFEHKCRGCDYYYKIYTPDSEEAYALAHDIIGT